MKGMIDKLDTLIKYGYTPIPDTNGYFPARITAVHRDRYELICEYGETYGRLKSSVYFNEDSVEEFPTVGDFVLIQYNPLGDSFIVRTLERKTVFVRKDPYSKLHRSCESDVMQAVAASHKS